MDQQTNKDGVVDADQSPYKSPVTDEAPLSSVPSDRAAGWAWVPSLYFAEGLPYVVVMTLAVILYKRLGISNEEIGLYTSLLYLPWVIKPLWSPLVDVIGTQRRWILATQMIIGLAMCGAGAMLESDGFFFSSLAFFWVMAIGSATHDIAADGFYMAGLSEKTQAWFVGIRSCFYRLAMIAGQGLLVMLAGQLEGRLAVPTAWKWTLIAAGGFYMVLSLYHSWALPKPNRVGREERRPLGKEFVSSVTTFFAKPGIFTAIAFILFYRFAEAQLGKMAQPFLLDDLAEGGLAMSTSQVGFLYGTVGVLLLLGGGVIGGMLASRDGVRRWLLPMVFAINIPNAVYLFLAFGKPTSMAVIGSCVAVEQFGYGFGFAGYLLVMLEVSRGPHQTAHYALCTGLMALGMMLPGMVSGYVQAWLDYPGFFAWVMIATLPSFAMTMLVYRDSRLITDAEPAAESEP